MFEISGSGLYVNSCFALICMLLVAVCPIVTKKASFACSFLAILVVHLMLVSSLKQVMTHLPKDFKEYDGRLITLSISRSLTLAGEL